MTNSGSGSYLKHKILDGIRNLDPANNPAYKKLDGISLSRLFSDVTKDIIRYNVTQKAWNVYDGMVWKPDLESMETERIAKIFTDAMYIYSGDADESWKTAAAKLGNRKNRVALIQDARDFNYISADMLDKNDNLFNCQNCVIDLNTFKVIEHSPDQLLSKVSRAVYDPDASSADFEKFIDEIMDGDQEKSRYLQKTMGMCLTVNTEQEEFYLLYGSTTRNGKSTLLETISYMLGDYSLTMTVETLAQTKRDSRNASGDLARLKDVRMVTAAEPPKRMLLNVELLKSLVGRDTITARHLYEREFQFIPCFKLLINTNYLPVVTDDTLFKSDRVKVISFDRHFDESEQDKSLKGRLRSDDNLSGILNWCLEGLRLYRSEGLNPPASVIKATEQYRTESDKIGLFFTEVMVPSDHNTTGKDVYQAYARWCKANNYGTESKKNFFSDLKSRNLLHDTGTVNGFTAFNVVKSYVIDDGFSHEFATYDLATPFDQ